MTQQQIIRAWKDPEYRASLSAAELRAIPAHPAGLVEMSDGELMEVSGGTTLLCVTIAVSVIVLVAKCSDDSTSKDT
jgi:mersacidin/lichenicidin family type 2 lantibiotic